MYFKICQFFFIKIDETDIKFLHRWENNIERGKG